uniref:Ninja-family protein n=1 Tax=Gladiolus x hybridus TaxID=1769200 RepID=A0A0U3A2U0_9ASPA|nr:abscisic acid insensitive 5 binding protein-like protein [Gladiolus x hybridus]
MAAEGEIEDLSSLRMASTHPRDLLRRFAGEEAAPGESGGVGLGEVELSLGLSLGGCFSQPNREKRPAEMGLGLVRSSSISFLPMDSSSAAAAESPEFPASPAMGILARTCSLPVETEEERRRRKEMQSLKRMEAKRKRSEKRAKERREEEVAPLPPTPPPAPALPEKEELGGKAMAAAVITGWTVGVGKPASQGSIGSQGSSSSVLSDFDSRPGQVLDATRLSNCMEVRSPLSSAVDNAINRAASLPSMGRHGNSSKEEDEPSKRRRTSTGRSNGVKETERNILEEMPCVSTKGDGPNGRRIEGFLYKYRKGEEVRIMCVCHGSFLTPAEFVKHAGGGDVDHPLRHIVVNPNPSGLL